MSLLGSSTPINKTFLESSPWVPVKKAQEAGLFGADGLSFKDVLDTVNPLQQLPGWGMVYRAQTGDTISPVAKIAGAAIFGGPIGAAVAAVDSLIGAVTGTTASDAVVAAATAPATPTPPVSQDVAQALADQTLAKEAADKSAEEKVAQAEAEKLAAAHDALSRAAGVKTDTVDPKTITDTATTTAAPLTQNAGQFVYARQERLYENKQAMEGLYKTAGEVLKTNA